MATTPPPPSPSRLRIPPTPRHGAGYDSYEPYSTRHSARLAGQRASRDSHQTPPPSSPGLRAQTGVMDGRKQRGVDVGTLSPPGSTHTSPRKKTSGRSRGVVPADSLDNTELDGSNLTDAAEPTHPRQRSLQASHATMADGMLPTPAKTPRKKAVGDVGSAARTLFPNPSASARPKKGKKYTGFSLESFNEDGSENHEQIQIFTDSRDKIPQLDESEANPFYKKPTAAETSVNTASRTSKRRKVDESKRDKEVDDAVKRDDGMTYVFRGKKLFRKFDEEIDIDSDDDDLGLLAARPDLMDTSLTTSVRPLTRSSIKPRVLFPSAHQRSTQDTNASVVEEEEATDIEDHHGLTASHQGAPVEKLPVTPPVKSTITTPASPGATIRSLRSHGKHIAQDGTPTASEGKKEKRISPFHGWMRKKQQTPSPTGTGSTSKKREAETVGGGIGGPATKKSKGK